MRTSAVAWELSRNQGTRCRHNGYTLVPRDQWDKLFRRLLTVPFQ